MIKQGFGSTQHRKFRVMETIIDLHTKPNDKSNVVIAVHNGAVLLLENEINDIWLEVLYKTVGKAISGYTKREFLEEL